MLIIWFYPPLGCATKKKTKYSSQTRALTWQKHTCHVCRTNTGDPLVLHGDLEWKQHTSSRSHRKGLKRRANDTERAKRMKNDNDVDNDDTTTNITSSATTTTTTSSWYRTAFL